MSSVTVAFAPTAPPSPKRGHTNGAGASPARAAGGGSQLGVPELANDAKSWLIHLKEGDGGAGRRTA